MHETGSDHSREFAKQARFYGLLPFSIVEDIQGKKWVCKSKGRNLKSGTNFGIWQRNDHESNWRN